MRVLYVVPEGIDLGGIITSSENLMVGFREAGHEATFALLRGSSVTTNYPRGKYASQFRIGEGTGLMVHPVYGWRGPGYSTQRPDEFLALVNDHDVVVWGSMYGLRNNYTIGDSNWARCITGHKVPQVVMVRDDHLAVRTPWVIAFSPWIAGWAGVQQCSYNSCEGLGAPRALIFSGHGPADPTAMTSKRKKSAIAVATWKGWKQGRKLVHSAMYWTDLSLTLAGDGIDLRYMRSLDKARPADFTEDGRQIWYAAMESGRINYLGSITEAHRNKLLLEHEFAIDLSLRDNGGQINRSVVEAMRFGAVPICDPLFISGRADGNGDIFRQWEHYLPVDSSGTPEEVASQVNRLAKTPTDILNKIRKRNLAYCRMFDRAKAAEDLVSLALKKPNVGCKWSPSSVCEEKLREGRAAFRRIFGSYPDGTC